MSGNIHRTPRQRNTSVDTTSQCQHLERYRKSHGKFYTKSPNDLMPHLPPTAYKLYMAARSFCGPNGIAKPTNAQLMAASGLGRSTVVRGKTQLAKMKLWEVEEDRQTRKSSGASAIHFSDLAAFFLGLGVSRGVLSSGQVIPVQIKKQTKAKTIPLPPQAGDGECVSPVSEPRPEPPRPEPSPEVHEALQEARRFREERKRERRQQRYERNRERFVNRRAVALEAHQRVARHVLGILGLPLSGTATREAVERSALVLMNEQQLPELAAAMKLAGWWKGYRATCDSFRFEYPCGAVTFFAECRWKNPFPPNLQREANARMEACVGTAPPAFDREAAKAKQAATFARFGLTVPTKLRFEYEDGTYDEE